MTKKIGILTGGGDCNGLNAVIESVVKSAEHQGWQVDGIIRGWEGLILGNLFSLDSSKVDGIRYKGGTDLQTSRTNPYNYTGMLDGKHLEKQNVSNQVIQTIKKFGLEAVVVCGGDDTLSVIPRLIDDYESVVIYVAIPKTMDGDLQTYSVGLDTAINRAMSELKSFISILKSNSSIGIVEFFGRHVGRVTFKAGIAAGADVILVPEVAVDLDYLCDFIANRYNKRAEKAKINGVSPYVLIAVAEGTLHPITKKEVYLNPGEDTYGHGKLGGIGDKIAKLVDERLKNDPRIKAHMQSIDIKTERPTYSTRGGDSLYSDAYVGMKLGAAAIHYLKNCAINGMTVTNFNEDGQVELMPVQELIKPRGVHLKVLELFEQSGLICFGRKPAGK